MHQMELEYLRNCRNGHGAPQRQQASAAPSPSAGDDNMLNSIPRAPNEIASGQEFVSATSDELAANQWRQNNQQQQQQPTTTTTTMMSMIDLRERLSLMEKFITVITKKVST